MSSSTKTIRARRAMKKAGQNRKRKSHLRIHGSSAPNLPLNVPNANETAMKARKHSK